jgi:cytochrome c
MNVRRSPFNVARTRSTRLSLAGALGLAFLVPFVADVAHATWSGRVEAQTAVRTAADAADPSRFDVVTLVPMGELDEPLTFAVARDGRVFINERRTGHIKVFNPRGNTTTIVGTIPINHTYTSASGAAREAEEGFLGLTIDPAFDQNGWMYILYADPDVAKHVLARIQLRDETNAAGETVTRIVPNSYRMMLEYAAQRETCCHTGGGMTWDMDGNLYITVGNNTGNTGTSQTDERPGRANWDDQRGAANTNDLRGKILRIKPQPDGTYTIPPGNLFPPGTPRTRPEIYTMGHRNVWRVSVDSQTGYVYWGEVGPDNQADNPQIGPRGYDELNQAKAPGFFGWPYFVGPNAAFPFMDYVRGELLGPKDPQRPMNTSVNNTGIVDLPPAQPAFIGYEYGPSERFPEVGTGGRCAVGGPVFRRADFAANAPRVWPAYFEGKWLATDCSRAWIMAITMDASGNYQSMERFLPRQRWVEPMDMKFGPEGDLYLLDYGGTWFAKSVDSRLVRIEYNGGNRTPVAVASASRVGGRVPFEVRLSSAGSMDFDNDQLRYEWRVEAPGQQPRVFRERNPAVRLTSNGVYTATLTVSDAANASATSTVEIVGGNEPPAVALGVTGGLNGGFFRPGEPITYDVKVSDPEDGVVAPAQVAVSVNYVPEGFDVSALRQGQAPVDTTTKFAVAKAVMAQNSCPVCHAREGVSLGPSLPMLREKYPFSEATVNTLAGKVRNGGTGVWGTAMMPSHPLMSLAEARSVVEYFLRSGESTLTSLPLSGSYTAEPPPGDNGRGAVVVRAVYTDKGAGPLPARTTEAMAVLRSPRIGVTQAAVLNGAEVNVSRQGGASLVARAGGHAAFRGVDLTGVRRMEFVAQAGGRGGEVGGTIEVRLGSPTGALIGQATVSGVATAGPGRGVIAPGAAPAAPGTAPAAQAVAGRGAGAVATAAALGFPPTDLTAAAPAAGRGGRGGGAAAPAAVAAPPAGGGAGAAPAGGGGGRGGPGAAAPAGVSTDIQPTTGVHDVYLVFRNERASASQLLLNMSQITLVP